MCSLAGGFAWAGARRSIRAAQAHAGLNGPQYVTWRGTSQFAKHLQKRGIRQLVARPRRPQTLGKIERFWGTLWREFLQAAVFLDLTDARARIGHFIGTDEIRPILVKLFTEHGPPLVIKSDNGSAFRATETRGWMLAWEALQLFSPVGYPQYNGQLERSNAINKTYTHQHAVAEGHPQQWTQDDLEAARRLTNGISRPWGARGPTPDESWAGRAPITVTQRSAFAQQVTQQRQEARVELGLGDNTEWDGDAADEVDRHAMGRALEVCGYLTKVEQKCAPRRKRRRRRESLERALRQQRETSDTCTEHNGPSPPVAPPTSTPRRDRLSTQVLPKTEPEGAARNLAFARDRDTIPLVIDKRIPESHIRPPRCAAQRERPPSSRWRSLITLVVSKVKAAIIPR